MDKLDFLLALAARLEVLSDADKKASLDYYAEMLDDLVESGMTEAEAVASLGSVDDIAEEILMDVPLPKLVKAKMKKGRRLTGAEITLLIVGFPIWLPLLISAFAIVFSIYVSLWAVVISLYAADLSLAAGSLAGLVGTIMMFVGGQPATALLFLGAMLVLVGLSILLFFGCNAAAKGVCKLGKLTLRGIKACFVRKEGK